MGGCDECGSYDDVCWWRDENQDGSIVRVILCKACGWATEEEPDSRCDECGNPELEYELEYRQDDERVKIANCPECGWCKRADYEWVEQYR